MKRLLAGLWCLSITAGIGGNAMAAATDRPNVLIIYFDDMGWGDMGANAPTDHAIPEDSQYLDPQVPTLTPHLDAFAAQAMRFTNGHSADGVCTPSRYALMTGRYCWRTRLKKGVNGGYTPTLMEPDRLTIGKMFQSRGYSTAMVGKWHIGMQFHDSANRPVKGNLGNRSDVLEKNLIDFSKPVTDTPIHNAGFDVFFGTPASLDMPPYVWLQSNGDAVRVMSQGGVVRDGEVDFSKARGATNDDLVERQNFKRSVGIATRAGVHDPTFDLRDYLQIQAQKVCDLIHQFDDESEPFFIYVPMPAPHTPHAVQDQFVGSAGWTYGDYVVQTDHYTGQILDALGDPTDGNSIAAETVVFISSDNGPENGAYHTSLEVDHDANGPYAGRKRDNYEGGTRVPFLVRWPGVIQPGSVTDHLCWQGDFMATMADHLGIPLGPDDAPDAERFLPVLKGQPMPTQRRPAIIQHSSRGQFAIVDQSGEWKLLDGTGGGGNGTTCDADDQETLRAGKIRETPRQLFRLSVDPGERNNLLNDPDQAATDKESELYELLNRIRGDQEFGTDGNSQVPRP
ncbi:sulfatase family protein [Crateriforma conspicua]|uniref:sulfatase family protein n=1 Tax=Crateriforma conspicua TaxID=2527996 RepID=UPI00118A99B8|nr:arylsulfatase [Crateriforma conspicua]QDV62410.1 Arylsulfatase precursor [Crateriforma conspicua]